MTLQVKYYVRRKAFTQPDGDTYVKIIKRDDKEISFEGFVLYDNGTVEYRQSSILESKEAVEWIEAIQQQSDELSKEEFEKAEDEYLKRAKDETWQLIESDLFRKYFGIDVVGEKQKSIMARVEKALKEEYELRTKK